MRVPENWLRAYVDPDLSSDALAERLTMAGLEVEQVDTAAPPFSGVVVARVLAVDRHPNADKLTVCRVDAGEPEPRSIVCGAPNVAAGMRVPCALPGATLPGNFRITVAKMRGVESSGMLCSARELGLSEDHSGLLVLAPDAPIGRDVREWLSLDEKTFTLKLTPNRADCLSIVGVAREVAALTGAPLIMPDMAPVAVTLDETLPVKVLAPDLCGRFSGRIIRGVDARAATPDWIRRRLERAGQRPISALVDISNYVMLELGRPSHVFDLDRVGGPLEVRWGRAGERLELLSGQTVELDDSVGVIAAGTTVESLAGIMGGEATAVSLDTRNVYVEAAFWWPESVAGRSRRFNFSTDAGHRFERGVDYATTARHLEYISQLILSVCGGQAGPIDDHVVNLPERKPVTLRIERASRVIGAQIGIEEAAGVFRSLGMPVEATADSIIVEPPSYRFDLELEEDLIEEVARLRGYDRLELRAPRAPVSMLPAPESTLSIIGLKRRVAARDYQEVVNFSFVADRVDRLLEPGVDRIALLNPIAEHLNVMRSTLWGGLIENLRANLNRKASRVRMFEVGRVFRRDATMHTGPLEVEGVAQPQRLAGLAYGPAWDEQWGAVTRAVDFFDVKGDLEALFAPRTLQFTAARHPALHPGRSARVEADGRSLGWLGELHPSLQRGFELPQAPIVFDCDLDAALGRPLPSYREVSKFPPVIRDIAVVVDQAMPAQRLLDTVSETARWAPAARAIQHVRLFDEYRGKTLKNEEKSLALRIWMQDTHRTLNDEEADAAIQVVLHELGEKCGARLRG